MPHFPTVRCLAGLGVLIWPLNGRVTKISFIVNGMILEKEYYNIIGLKQLVMTTLQKQISLFTEEKSTFLPGDSLANHTALRAKEKERKMTATSGRRCLEQLEKFSQVGSWAKTFQALLIGQEGWYSKRCKLTWKMKGTKYGRMYFQLQVSTLPTKGIGSGLLLTPTTIERAEEPSKMRARAEKNGYKNGTKYNSLASQIVYGNFLPTVVASDATTGAIIGKNDKFIITKTGMPRKINQNGTDGSVGLARLGKLGMLPTPRARAAGGNTSNDRGKGNLEDAIAKAMLPTPTAQDFKRRGPNSKQQGLSNTENWAHLLPTPNASEGEKYCKTYNPKSQMGTALTPLMNKLTGKSSQLKPQFVMEMMGFPPDWTLLPFLNGEQNQSKEEVTQSFPK